MRAISFDLNSPISDGFLDRVEVDPCGLIRIVGWLRGEVSQLPKVSLDQQGLPFLHHYRQVRHDVDHAAQNITIRHAGVVFEYLADASMTHRKFQTLLVTLPSGVKNEFHGEFTFLHPHYAPLFSSREIYHRDNLYGSGPSNPAVHPEVLALARMLRGPLLDFGCGSGALISDLRQQGVDARGVELDTKQIRKGVKAGVEPAITFYNGKLPLDMPDRAFTSVFCSEVLEHIPDYKGAVREIARLASKEVIFTVPDMSAVPIGFRHSLVPWHLMEGTHVNFFTQESLHRLLKPFFSKIEFSRIGECQMNDSRFFTSLVAFCSK